MSEGNERWFTIRYRGQKLFVYVTSSGGLVYEDATLLAAISPFVLPSSDNHTVEQAVAEYFDVMRPEAASLAQAELETHRS
jgi:hypothetical protein